MKFGAHVSIAGGIENAPQRAHDVGCECFQIFSRSPRGGKVSELDDKTVENFKKNLDKYNIKEFYVHAPYFINLGSKNNRIYHGSISVIRQELERGSKIGAKYLMVHLGSAKDLGEGKSIKKVVQGLTKILDGYNGETKLLIEISAGAGKIIGDNFEEIAEIIKKTSAEIGVCFDTAHAFESGYDLSTKAEVEKTFAKFDKTVGLDRLKLLHGNDSKTDLGSHSDRHEHIGKGKIGLKGFKAIVKHPKLKNVNLIIETPKGDGDKWDKKNLKLLKSLRDGK